MRRIIVIGCSVGLICFLSGSSFDDLDAIDYSHQLPVKISPLELSPLALSDDYLLSESILKVDQHGPVSTLYSRSFNRPALNRKNVEVFRSDQLIFYYH